MQKIGITLLTLAAVLAALFSSTASAVCTDPGGGAAQLCNDDGYLVCDQQRPLVVQYPNATKTQNACTVSTVASTDIGTVTPYASGIPVAGTDATIAKEWLPTSVLTGTGTTNYIPKKTASGYADSRIYDDGTSPVSLPSVKLTSPGGSTDPLWLVKGTGTGGFKLTFDVAGNYLSYLRTYEDGTNAWSSYMDFGVPTSATTSALGLRIRSSGVEAQNTVVCAHGLACAGITATGTGTATGSGTGTFRSVTTVPITMSATALSTNVLRATGGLVWQNTATNTGTLTGTRTVTATETALSSDPTIKALSPFTIRGNVPYGGVNSTTSITCGQLPASPDAIGCGLGDIIPAYDNVFLHANLFTSRLGAYDVAQTSLLAGNSSDVVGCSLRVSPKTFACDTDVALVGANLTEAGEARGDVHKTDTISFGQGDYAFAYRTGTDTTTDTSTGTGTSCPLGRSCTAFQTSTTTVTATVTNSVNGKSIALNPTLTNTDVGALAPNGVSVSVPSLVTSATDGQINNSRAMISGDVTGALGFTPADRGLSNLSSVAINASLLPGTSASIDLGSTSYKWRAAYFSSQINAATVYTTGDISSEGAVYGDNLTSAGHAIIDVGLDETGSGGFAGPASDTYTSSTSWVTVVSGNVTLPLSRSAMLLNATVTFTTPAGHTCTAGLFVGGTLIQQQRMSGPTGIGGNPGGCGSGCGEGTVAVTGRYTGSPGTYAVSLRMHAGGVGSTCYVLAASQDANLTYLVGPSL